MSEEHEAIRKIFEDPNEILDLPPGFFQRGIKHVLTHPGEEFELVLSQKRATLRRFTKERILGKKGQYERAKSPINGQAIAWIPLRLRQGINPYQGWTLQKLLDLIRKDSNPVKY